MILALIAGIYIVGVGIFVFLTGYWGEEDAELAIFWPFILGLAIMVGPFIGLHKLGEWIAKKGADARENREGKWEKENGKAH